MKGEEEKSGIERKYHPNVCGEKRVIPQRVRGKATLKAACNRVIYSAPLRKNADLIY